MKFQDKFYDIIGHKKCPSSEKSAEKCIWRKSNFPGILPIYNTIIMSSLPVSSIAAYAQQLEDMIAEKQEQLETLREKTRAFR